MWRARGDLNPGSPAWGPEQYERSSEVIVCMHSHSRYYSITNMKDYGSYLDLSLEICSTSIRPLKILLSALYVYLQGRLKSFLLQLLTVNHYNENE